MESVSASLNVSLMLIISKGGDISDNTIINQNRAEKTRIDYTG